MSTTFDQNTTQYAALYVSRPGTAQEAYGGKLRYFPFDITLAAGTAPVTVGLVKLPPHSTLLMLLSSFWFAGATATETIDIGWDAYKDVDGTAVVADDDGLIDGVLMTTDATWAGGALITAAAIAQSLPIVNRKVFSNRDEVAIYASLKVANPGANDTLNGYFAVVTP